MLKHQKQWLHMDVHTLAVASEERNHLAARIMHASTKEHAYAAARRAPDAVVVLLTNIPEGNSQWCHSGKLTVAA